MRILHLTSTLEKSSGVMNIIMSYANILKNNGIYFDFLYFNESDHNYQKEIELNGGRIYKISRPKLGLKYKNYIKEVLINLNKNNSYKILHIHDVYLTFLFAPIAKKQGIDNIITHSHATSYSDKKLNALRNRILCLNIKKHSTKYVACSNAAGRFLYGDKAFDKGLVTVIPNAIDVDKFRFDILSRDELRKEYNIKDDEFLIGHIGRFSKQKNHLFLIKLFEKASKENNKLKLMLIGDGPLSNEIDNHILKLNLTNRIIRVKSTSRVNNYLSMFDLFVLPSLFEGLPIVGVEAQCSGLTCLFSNNITNEIVLGNSKSLSIKSENDWKNEIIKLAKTKFNSSRETGVTIIKEGNYEINIESKKLNDLYHNILEK